MTSPLLRAFLSRLFTSACAIISAFVSLKLYSIFLTKEIYGVTFVSTQILGYLPLTGAGFIGVLNQRILSTPDPSAAAGLSRFAQFLQNCTFLVAIGAALLLMEGYTQTKLVRSSGLPVSLFLSIGLAFAVTFYTTGQFSFLIGLGRQTQCYLMQGALQLLTSLLLFLGFVLKFGVWAIPFASGFSALVLFVPLRQIVRARLKDLPLFVLKPLPGYKDLFLGVWRPALDSLMAQGWSMLTFSLDAILVGLLVGPAQAAIYGVLSRLTGISRHFLQALGETAWPRLAQANHPEIKAQLMRKVDRLNAWNVGTWFGAMFATIIPFLGWFLKADWVAGELLIALVLLRHAVISLNGPHVFGIISLGLFRENAIISRREVIFSVIPAVLLSYRWGTLGIASGYLLGSCLVSGCQITRVYFRAQGRPWLPETWAIYSRFTVGATLAYSLGAILWHLCKGVGNAPGWLAAISGGLAFGASWAATGGVELLRQSRQANAQTT